MASTDEILAAWSAELPAAVTPSSALSKSVLALAHRLREAIGQAVAAYDLTMAEYDLLVTLRRGGTPFRARPTDLTGELLLTSGGTAKALASLGARGLVVREIDRTDRRTKWVRMTADGVELAEQALLASTSAQASVFDHVPADQLDETTLTMRRLVQLLGS